MKVENCDVGFIGLGVMGKSMAERLRAAGAKMHVFTRTKKSAEEILSKGAVWYDDPASLAPNCKIIFTIVGYPQDVEETYFGEKGLLKTAKPGTIFADMTTSSPILAKKIYDEAKKKECFSVDAPVSGGDIGAKKEPFRLWQAEMKKPLKSWNLFLPAWEKLGLFKEVQGQGSTLRWQTK